MINKDLSEYFAFCIKKGETKESLVDRAKKKGWSDSDIDDSLSYAEQIVGKGIIFVEKNEVDKEVSNVKAKEDVESEPSNIQVSTYKEDNVDEFNANIKLSKENDPITLAEIEKEKKEIEQKLAELKSQDKDSKNKKTLGFDMSKSGQKGILETYEIEVDKAKVSVDIAREISVTIYNLHVPEIGAATATLLGEIRNKLVAATTISMKEITDPSAFLTIKKRFMNEATNLLKERLPKLDQEKKDFLVGKLMQDMLGLGEIEFLVNDPNLEEVVIPSAKEPIRVYHKRYGWLLSNLRVAKEDEIVNYSNIVARRVGRQITVLTPLLDAHLVSGDRVNAILYPISTKGNTITIRKFARDPYTIIDLINSKTISLDISALLWLAIEYEMNVLISGGTASGKTVLLNACMPFIPPSHRIISVEDTRELMLPDFLYWTPLVTRLANPEGKGGVSMLDLLINSLRMRPDRIILGEMRRQEEAMVLFEAMHTGHSVYATLHADSGAETINRLTNPPLSVPPNLLKAVNLNVIMFRDRRRGIRRILQIAEFVTSENHAEANIIYRWIPEEDKLIKHSENSRFFEDINRNTGLSEDEVQQNLDKKKDVLNWLIKSNIRDLYNFGKVMNLYYTDREMLMNYIKLNDTSMFRGKSTEEEHHGIY